MLDGGAMSPKAGDSSEVLQLMSGIVAFCLNVPLTSPSLTMEEIIPLSNPHARDSLENHAKAVTRVLELYTSSMFHVFVSQMQTLPSRPAVARRDPSELKATFVIPLE